MLGEWRILRTFDRSFWLTTAAWGLTAFAYFGVQAVLLNLYLLRLGFSLEFIGGLIGAGQITWALAALPAGAVGRRMGLRATLASAHILQALGFGLLLLVEALPRPWWNAWLYGTWMLLWVGAALQAVNSVPYMMHLVTETQRNHAFSSQGIVQVLMAFAGSVVAGLLPGLVVARFGGSLDLPGPYRWALWLGPALFAVGLLFRLGARHVDLPEPAETARADLRPLGLFAFLGLVTFLQTASEGAIRAFFNVYLDVNLKIPVAYIGTTIGVGQLFSVLAIVAMPWLLNRWGVPLIMFWATVALALALVPLAAIPHWTAASLAFVGVMATTSMTATARGIFSQEMVPAQWHTTSSAVAIVGLGMGWAGAAAAGGYTVGAAGFAGLFYISAALAGVAAALLWAYVRIRPKRARVAGGA
jgi:MFS family permease